MFIAKLETKTNPIPEGLDFATQSHYMHVAVNDSPDEADLIPVKISLTTMQELTNIANTMLIEE